ncbi:MAG: PHP domain-containing protein [Candidatus Eremiobacteraeota bacterium]|nr:PHP domain-containing protein [Candidatus Eremiobacteraeota bacterium]MBC5807638.1 PHP domain-containing protein [Candidatus Eremiobacteraeota bacterium]
MLTPEELMRCVATAGLDYFSVTDHDTIAAYQRHSDVFAPHRTRLINGIEVSTVSGEREVHILAYRCAGDGELTTLMGDRPALRRARVEHIVGKLSGCGVAITMEAVQRHARGDVLGRPHVARALVQNGYATDVSDAFARYLGAGAPAYVASTTVKAQDVIAAIRHDGGVAVLAHPLRNDAEAEVERLARCGLQGIEAFSPSHQEHDVDRLRSLAAKLGLVKTAGSDFHGPTETRPRPGVTVERAEIDSFLELCGRSSGGRGHAS